MEYSVYFFPSTLLHFYFYLLIETETLQTFFIVLFVRLPYELVVSSILGNQLKQATFSRKSRSCKAQGNDLRSTVKNKTFVKTVVFGDEHGNGREYGS